MKNRIRINFYKTNYTPFERHNFNPRIEKSKNVQGWFFTRTLTLYWLRYAISISLTRISDLDIDRKLAHRQNTVKYLTT